MYCYYSSNVHIILQINIKGVVFLYNDNVCGLHKICKLFCLFSSTKEAANLLKYDDNQNGK